MTGQRAYLDHNASTPLRPAAAEAVARAVELCGNPSSVHAEGRAARAAIDRARHQVAAAVGGEARNVVFTSGATEALNTLLRPSQQATRLLALATEHSASLAGGGFAADAVTLIPVDADGVASVARLDDLLAESGAAAVAAQYANSETGVIQPLPDIASVTKRYDAIFISDAVAAMGKIPVDIQALGADAIVLSAHKFGGPKGVGAFVLNGDRLRIEEPLLKGGGQEMRRRSGTENVAGIVGMGAAAEEAVGQLAIESERLLALRNRLLDGFRAIRPDLVVFGEKAPRLPNTLNLGVPGLRSETAVIAFDLAGVAVSSGSACSSGKVKRSHVLDAMGVAPALADGALRFSLGWTTKAEDIGQAIAAIGRIAGGARRMAAA
ncbi:MAG: cysteine desulfurase family protein [Beijerinckiaceae bacterium]